MLRITSEIVLLTPYIAVNRQHIVAIRPYGEDKTYITLSTGENYTVDKDMKTFCKELERALSDPF